MENWKWFWHPETPLCSSLNFSEAYDYDGTSSRFPGKSGREGKSNILFTWYMAGKETTNMREMAGLTGPHHFQMEGWISCAPFERLLQMEIIEASEGCATLKMPFLVDFAQGGGLMHGGALVSLADTAVAMAIKSVVPAGTRFVTTSLRAEFLRAVKMGVVTAKAEATCQGGSKWKGEASVYDEVGRVVLEFSSFFRVLEGA